MNSNKRQSERFNLINCDRVHSRASWDLRRGSAAAPPPPTTIVAGQNLASLLSRPRISLGASREPGRASSGGLIVPGRLAASEPIITFSGPHQMGPNSKRPPETRTPAPRQISFISGDPKTEPAGDLIELSIGPISACVNHALGLRTVPDRGQPSFKSRVVS